MKEYGKLCGWLAEWLWKPFWRIVLALCAIELLYAAFQLKWYAHFFQFLDEAVMLIAPAAALLLFLLFVWQRLGRFWGSSRGIYTIAALPAPGWVFPASVYTVTAVGLLAVAAVQLLLVLLFYGMFRVQHGAGQGLYLEIVRAKLFRCLLPHTPFTVTRTALLFEVAVLLPLQLMHMGFWGRLRGRTGRSAKPAEIQEISTTILILFYLADGIFLRNHTVLRNIAWFAAFLVCALVDQRNWTKRKNEIGEIRTL